MSRAKEVPLVTEETPWRPQAEINEVKARFTAALRKKLRFSCQYPSPSPCSDKVIDSHSVQRSPILRRIADSTGHVIMMRGEFVPDDPPFDERAHLGARRVGLNLATTFRGLCSTHDSSTFTSIELSDPDPTRPEHAFLLAYRAVLMETHGKAVMAARFKAIAEAVSVDSAAHPLAGEVSSLMTAGSEKGKDWVSDLKVAFDKDLLAQNFATPYSHWSATLTVEAPFALASCFTPTWDFWGKKVNQFTLAGPPPNWISLTILPFAGKTVVSLTTPANRPFEITKMCAAIEQASGARLELLLSELALANVENIAFAPAFWSALTATRQQAITDYFVNTINGGKSEFPASEGNLFRS